MASTGTVGAYLEGLDPADAEVIGHVYAVAREVVPEAEEGTGYGMAALTYRGKPLLAAVRAAKHVGLYPFSGDVVATVAPDVTAVPGASTSKGAVRFAPASPLPDDVVRARVTARRDQIDAL
jgi:uncharacterized protein YdhG (YjbR/CyaY superfamily)